MSSNEEEKETFSAEDMTQVMTAVYCVILPSICIVGIFGNALTFSVFYREKKKTSTTVLLLGLALADELCMVGQALFIFLQIRNLHFKEDLSFLNINTFFLLRLVFSLESISKALTVVIVIERCLAVFRPFYVHRTCSKHIGILLTTSVYFITLSSCSVELFQINPRGNSSNSTYEMAILTTGEDGTFRAWYGVVLHLVYGITTVLLIMGFNTAIIVGLRQMVSATRRFKHWKRGYRWNKQQKITRMLLTMSVTYVVCCLPSDVCYVLLIRDKERLIAHEGNFNFRVALLFTYCLAVLNNAVNFLVYALTVNSMRRKYRETLSCCRFENNNHSSSELFAVITTRL
ncbi:somatostatin receptor type 2-like [Argopecten irradians]|uniref:somatostatin receptor type 2-like n=1 Tax=Argopecten irradians TaxID=31199 RepID=UPI00372020F3